MSRVNIAFEMSWTLGHTPLNPMHFSPTSLINSAVSTDCVLSFDPAVARLYSSVKPSGEFIVIVAAVFQRQTKFLPHSLAVLTDKVSHAGTPTFLDDASFRRLSYTERIRAGAGRVFGRANGALMSAFKLGESFDISLSFLLIQISRNSVLLFPDISQLKIPSKSERLSQDGL